MSKLLNSNHDDPKNMLGVSVHWLKTGFMDEVKAAGLSDNTKIYEIEDLKQSTGVIREKGKDIVSPIDQRKGSAYVHCLQGEDNVGHATVMLSYTWGYTIGMIIQTLEDWCRSKGKDAKSTYVWICCLCVNQHRVVEKQSSGITVSSEEFFNEFGKRVTSIGTVLALMEPWDSPKYLSRIWCVFEVYWAHVHNCNVEIIMPQEQKDLMTKSIIRYGNKNQSEEVKNNVQEKQGIDKLYEVLSNIDIEKADASVLEDKVKILEMISNDVGYVKLNNIVNGLLRTWISKTIDELLLQKSNEINNDNGKSNLESYANLCYCVGEIFWRNGEYDESMKMYHKCLEMYLDLYGKNHENTASTYHCIGNVLLNKGDYDNALIEYKKSLTIRSCNLGKDHERVAVLYNDIGNVLANKGDYNNALIEYKKALTIRLVKLGKDHADVATTYNNIGLALSRKGKYDKALVECKKALTITLSTLGKNHPSVATTYSNIGSVLCKKGCYDSALIEYRKAMTIAKSLLGEDHPHLATTYNNIGVIIYNKGDYDNALIHFNKALEIRRKVFGEEDHHPETKDVLKWIEIISKKKKEKTIISFKPIIKMIKNIIE